MDRNVASDLAAQMVVGLPAESGEALRIALAETLTPLDSTGPRLVRRSGGGSRKLYILNAGGLVIVTILEPPGIDYTWVDLTEARVTREVRNAREMPGGVYWETTWRVEGDHVSEAFSGREGPPPSTDACADFGRAVATAVGWPLASQEQSPA